jgi:hypothetical protein
MPGIPDLRRIGRPENEGYSMKIPNEDQAMKFTHIKFTQWPDLTAQYSLAYLLFVLGGTEQGINRVGFCQLHFDQPAVAVGVSIYEC